MVSHAAPQHPHRPVRGPSIRCAAQSRAAGEVFVTPIIELRGVSKRFGPTYDAAARLARNLGRRFGRPESNDTVQAVDRVDLAIARGEVVGLVGESGCG